MTKEELLAIKERLQEYKKVGEWAPLVRDAYKDIEALLKIVEQAAEQKIIELNPKKHV